MPMTSGATVTEKRPPKAEKRDDPQGTPRPVRILRIKDVCYKTGMARSTIYGWLKEGSEYYDPTFPKSVRIGAKAVGWLESEIDDWIQKRIDAARE